ncbi:MAG: amino acid ABC transporter substrate-binding protein [Coprococcus sp. 43_8]|nr:MAG: amino acid ABC transporter substrate-binding protein [Coprococcus sp. 43_8]
MKKRLIAVLMCAAMVTVLGAGCGSKKEDTKETSDAKKEYTEDELKDSMKGVKLKVGTTGLFGPFTYYDEDGKTLIGYDVDLLNDLQELLGFEIDGGLQAMDYSALTTSLAENKLDIGAAALCATDERKEVMDFSDIYCDSGQVVIAKDKKIGYLAQYQDIHGHHTIYEELMTTKQYITAYESLEQGKVDAVIQDGPGAYFYIKTTPDSNLEVVGDEFNQGQAPYCVAISKECKYYDEINAAVKVLIDNGTTDELYAKWCE